MTTYTKSWLSANCGCYSPERLASCSFMQTEGDTSLKAIIDSEIPLKHRFWFLCRKVLSKQENQQLAIECAEAILPLWKEKYPEDERPQAAIQAAKDYMAGKISSENLKEAAADTYAASYVAYAASYAADAVAASYAASYAADAAAAAHVATAAYAAAAYVAAYAAIRFAAAAASFAGLESILKKYAEKYY